MPKPYRSFSGSLIDPEKQHLTYEDESDSAQSRCSSRSTSTSQSPMLKDHYSTIIHKTTWSRRFPHRHFTRYFTLFISTSLLLFIFFLIKASWISQAEVQNAVTQLPDPTPEWEQFPVLKRYFGGIRTLVSRAANEVEYPLSEELEAKRLEEVAMQRKINDELLSSKRDTWQSRSMRFDPFTDNVEKPVSCSHMIGNGTVIPQLLSYRGVPSGFPNPVMGSYEALGLRNDVCFDRYGRLGPYGYGYSKTLGGSSTGMDGETDGKDRVWADDLEVDYRTVKWANTQQDCMAANAHRFKASHESVESGRWSIVEARDLESGSPSEQWTHEHATHEQATHEEATLEEATHEQATHEQATHEQATHEQATHEQATHEQATHEQTTHDAAQDAQSKETSDSKVVQRLLPRTAVLIRTWDDYIYDEEDMFNLRALINELSLQSGGEYEVHFLVHLKNESQQVWGDEQSYHNVLKAALPEEFHGMGTLWSEQQMALIYGGLDEIRHHELSVHGVYRSTFMPVQYFAHKHPEYDFIWNWEMDIRYTGHFYHLFDRASKWAQSQPRKGLWERNGRFYVPAKHGSYEDFRQMVRVQIEHGTASRTNLYSKLTGDASTTSSMDDKSRRIENPIWGPQPPESDKLDASHDPVPPTSYDKDNYEWGVGEDADLITFNPLFDPQGTTWLLAEDITGYNSTVDELPRRAAIGTGSRLSRRLLEAMHRETAINRHTMFSEMWPATCALHHGFKAVYVPHPVYVDRAWPTSYLAAVFNNGRNGASGGARTSIFSDRRQHNFKGTTWYYDALFGAQLWQRWLGYKIDEEGGEEFEVLGEGRMCLPAMLLHPVKHVGLITERAREGEQREIA